MSCLESTLDPNFYVTVFRLYWIYWGWRGFDGIIFKDLKGELLKENTVKL
jgi:hypothetical protein